MLRVSIVKMSKFGSVRSVSKQSQKMLYSSKNVSSLSPIPHTLWTATSIEDLGFLKKRHDVILAGLNERHELEIKHSQEKQVLAGMKERHELEIKYSQEKQELLLHFLEESHSVQLGKEINKQQCLTKSIELGTDAVPKASLSVVGIPKWFKNEDEINAFCDDLYHMKIKEFTPRIAAKIVYVLNNFSGNADCHYKVLNGVCLSLDDDNGQNASNLSAAGFGKALSNLLFTHSENFKCVDRISWIFWYDSLSNVKYRYAQDLYDAIDSPDGYNGEIFDTLLKIMQRQNERAIVETGFAMAFYLNQNTRWAKSIMIKEGFLDVVENFDSDYNFRDELKIALKKLSF